MSTTWRVDGWPMVEYHAAGDQGLADVQRFLGGLDVLLARGARFGVVTAKSAVRYTEPGPSATAQIGWMAANEAVLRARLVGMANVVEPAEFERERRAMPARAAHVPFPTAVFDGLAPARGWLAGLLG